MMSNRRGFSTTMPAVPRRHETTGKPKSKKPSCPLGLRGENFFVPSSSFVSSLKGCYGTKTGDDTDSSVGIDRGFFGMSQSKLSISVLPESLAICRLDAGEAFPQWANQGGFISMTRTQEEVTIICSDAQVPEGVHASHHWRALKLEGPLDLDLVGILVSVAAPLAQANIGIFPLGTYDTDYILVREAQLEAAVKALRFVGFNLRS